MSELNLITLTPHFSDTEALRELLEEICWLDEAVGAFIKQWIDNGLRT